MAGPQRKRTLCQKDPLHRSPSPSPTRHTAPRRWLGYEHLALGFKDDPAKTSGFDDEGQRQLLFVLQLGLEFSTRITPGPLSELYD
ncbi:hypothetical protein D7Y27_05345 [Corallococcus sp. AB004]|nr:hypothetical protein D7Y27_05345 [Corallococcus sp. AB004]